MCQIHDQENTDDKLSVWDRFIGGLFVCLPPALIVSASVLFWLLVDDAAAQG